MPPIFISPLAKIVVATLGEARVGTATDVEARLRKTFPTLRRDPRNGDWRVTG